MLKKTVPKFQINDVTYMPLFIYFSFFVEENIYAFTYKRVALPLYLLFLMVQKSKLEIQIIINMN